MSRWENEGLKAGTDLYDYFGLDRCFIYYPDDSPRLEPKLVEQDEDTCLATDSYGRLVRKWKTSTATPASLRYGIQDISEARSYMSRYYEIVNEIVGVAPEDATPST